jgi:hypothetical protein
MGYLKDSNCYLSGAIEADKSKENWRLKPIDELITRFQINVFDPHADPKQGKAEELALAKKNKDLKAIHDITAGFVRKDLAQIDRSDFLIGHFSYEQIYYLHDLKDFVPDLFNPGRFIAPEPHLRQIPTTGTIHEVINSDLYHKPTLLVCELGAHMIPSWLIGFIPLRYLFGSWDELYIYLQEVDEGKHMSDNRWAYVYKLI